MPLPPLSEHFQGKTVPEHLLEARRKGALAAAEMHGVEMAGHFGAAADAAKDTAFALLILWTLLLQFPLSQLHIFFMLLLFGCGWLIWKTGRSALLGWARVERLHRLIEEERWEIQHHRQQEREELTELYQAKGFSGKLLNEVVDVLMADDNRLLRVMIEEELGLTLEALEHPLKQCAGAAIGTLCALIPTLFGFWISSLFGLPLLAGVVIAASAAMSAKLERNRALPAVIWNLALTFLVCGAAYFLKSFIL